MCKFISAIFVYPMILAVRAYQVVLSPLFRGCCRFEPSCSEYMIESLKVHGPIKGLLLGIYRILRCHPFGKSGYDPVPAKNCWTNKLGDTANE
jgi:putative membrane protein insertion efficiency factor